MTGCSLALVRLQMEILRRWQRPMCWGSAGQGSTLTRPEDGLLRTTYRMGYEEKELVVDTWFSQEPLTPVRAEISFEGRMVLRTDISAFSMRQPTQLTEE